MARVSLSLEPHICPDEPQFSVAASSNLIITIHRIAPSKLAWLAADGPLTGCAKCGFDKEGEEAWRFFGFGRCPMINERKDTFLQ
eukprot:scaffold6367_cov153-Skeletonema_menzelii.AAC.7